VKEEPTHIAIQPSAEVVKRAEKIAGATSARKGEPAFHMTETLGRLSTPWSIAKARAEQIDATVLPAGVILDAAAGSGVQLIALTTGLRRPGLLSRSTPISPCSVLQTCIHRAKKTIFSARWTAFSSATAAMPRTR
jgi:hypothetical protein